MPVIKPVKDGRFFIKWLHASYLDEIADLECTSCERMWSRVDLMKLMYSEDTGGYIISDLDKPVGYIAYTINRDEFLLRLLNLVIHPDYRNLGLGTLLLDRVELLARKQPECEGIEAFVRENNLGAHLFLKRRGFISTQVHRGFFVDHYANETEYADAYYFLRKEKDYVKKHFNIADLDARDSERQLDGTGSF